MKSCACAEAETVPSTPTMPRASPTASSRGDCPISWEPRGRAWRSIPPARRRWWRCTWPAKACGRRDATWRWPGGVNVILTPENAIALSKAGMMATDGRCKTFDDAPTALCAAKAAAWLCSKESRDALTNGDPHPGRDSRIGRQSGRRQQRPDRSQRTWRRRPSSAARWQTPAWRRWRCSTWSARHRNFAGRPHRSAVADESVRQGPRPPMRRCSSARSKPTSAISRPRPASPV